jgi:hypothetical protein
MKLQQEYPYEIIIGYEITKSWSRRDSGSVSIPADYFNQPAGIELMEMLLKELQILDSKGLPTDKAKDYRRKGWNIRILSYDWVRKGIILDTVHPAIQELLKGPDTIEDTPKSPSDGSAR